MRNRCTEHRGRAVPIGVHVGRAAPRTWLLLAPLAPKSSLTASRSFSRSATGGPSSRRLVGRLSCVRWSPGVRDRGRRRNRSECELEFVACGRQAVHGRGLNSHLVVAPSQVMDEGVSSNHDAGRPVGLQPPHRSRPGLHPALIGLAPVVLVLAGVVERRRDQLVDHVRQAGARSLMTSAGE